MQGTIFSFSQSLKLVMALFLMPVIVKNFKTLSKKLLFRIVFHFRITKEQRRSGEGFMRWLCLLSPDKI